MRVFALKTRAAHFQGAYSCLSFGLYFRFLLPIFCRTLVALSHISLRSHKSVTNGISQDPSRCDGQSIENNDRPIRKLLILICEIELREISVHGRREKWMLLCSVDPSRVNLGFGVLFCCVENKVINLGRVALNHWKLGWNVRGKNKWEFAEILFAAEEISRNQDRDLTLD